MSSHVSMKAFTKHGNDEFGPVLEQARKWVNDKLDHRQVISFNVTTRTWNGSLDTHVVVWYSEKSKPAGP